MTVRAIALQRMSLDMTEQVHVSVRRSACNGVCLWVCVSVSVCRQLQPTQPVFHMSESGPLPKGGDSAMRRT